jgi:uncharacterized protein (TIGR00369 family)
MDIPWLAELLRGGPPPPAPWRIHLQRRYLHEWPLPAATQGGGVSRQPGADPPAARRMSLALEVPLLRFLGVSPVDDLDPAAGVEFSQSAQALNAVDALHGGAISTVLDVAAYLALLPQLADDEEAATHMVSLSYLARAETGAQLVATAEILRRGRNLAFLAATLSSGGRLLAAANVTKSILAGAAGPVA